MTRRFTTTDLPGSRVVRLAPDHPAMIDNRPLFTWKIGEPAQGERVIKSGSHNRKLDAGTFRGVDRKHPIMGITLRERTDCPPTCVARDVCTGNKMHYARRFVVGPRFYDFVTRECAELSLDYPDGWLLRLHILGDFVSAEYVGFWEQRLVENPPLKIFGFTAHERGNEIGRRIDAVSEKFGWRRFAIRFSGGTGPTRSAHVLNDLPSEKVVDGFHVCPAKMHWAESCSRCGLCWNSELNIGFPVT
jgi:hypothetical protein